MQSFPELEFARTKLDELFATPAFKDIHERVSVVLVGSHMTDLADGLSDVDMFLYVPDECYEESRKASIEEGIMQPDGDWLINYRTPHELTFKVWSMTELRQQFEIEPVVSVRNLTTRKVWQDPQSQFAEVVAEYGRRFDDRLPEYLKDHSLWMRVRIKQAILAYKRGLSTTGHLIRADFVKLLFETAFLVQRRPYCHIKWLEHRAIAETKLGTRVQGVVAELLAAESIEDRVRLMKEAYLLTREVAIECDAPDPTLVNPEGDMATRVFESAFMDVTPDGR